MLTNSRRSCDRWTYTRYKKDGGGSRQRAYRRDNCCRQCFPSPCQSASSSSPHLQKFSDRPGHGFM